MTNFGGMLSMPVARATLREKGRGFLSVGVGALFVLSAVSNAAQNRLADEAFSGFAHLFLIVFTMSLGAGLIADEIESGHAQLVLLRPLTRAEWFGGRLAGATAVLWATILTAWLGGGIGALVKGGALTLSWAVTLPLTLIEGLAWMAVLAALSVLFTKWMNVGFVILVTLVYFFASFSVPMVLGKPQLMDTMRTIGHYLGPQGLDDVMRTVRIGQRPLVASVFYDLVWVFGPWLLGALFLNRRELARRRG